MDHLYRNVIRPFVRSYGDNSHLTRSPTRILIKFFRILPEIWARISALFSSSTLNMALGRLSVTTPSISIVVAMTSAAAAEFVEAVEDEEEPPRDCWRWFLERRLPPARPTFMQGAEWGG